MLKQFKSLALLAGVGLALLLPALPAMANHEAGHEQEKPACACCKECHCEPVCNCPKT